MNPKDETGVPLAPPDSAGDWFVLETRSQSWLLSPAMARAVDARLAEDVPPVWVVFVDLFGERVRVRSEKIDALSQCRAAGRDSWRRHHRALDAERTAADLRYEAEERAARGEPEQEADRPEWMDGGEE